MSASLCRRALAPRPTSALKARLVLVLAMVGSRLALYHLRVRQVQGHQVVVADTGAAVVMRPHYLLVGDVDEAGQMTLVQVMAGIVTPRGIGIVTASTTETVGLHCPEETRHHLDAILRPHDGKGSVSVCHPVEGHIRDPGLRHPVVDEWNREE